MEGAYSSLTIPNHAEQYLALQKAIEVHEVLNREYHKEPLFFTELAIVKALWAFAMM